MVCPDKCADRVEGDRLFVVGEARLLIVAGEVAHHKQSPELAGRVAGFDLHLKCDLCHIVALLVLFAMFVLQQHLLPCGNRSGT